MKALEFIKKNISVFNVICLLLIIILIHLIIQEDNNDYLSGMQLDEILFYKIKFIITILILILSDYLFKFFIRKRLYINILEFLIVVLFIIIYLF
ncbi:MAG: hypothetical protein CK517_03040 [Flavobacteriales bacterium]|nr:MAG: hypothetical protein CK517_03040 [Flavobacteriales bacterium]